jgi:hypothetical protein
MNPSPRQMLERRHLLALVAVGLLDLAVPAAGQQVLYSTRFDDAAGWTFGASNPTSVRFDSYVFRDYYSFNAPSPERALGFANPSGGAWPAIPLSGWAHSPQIDITGTVQPTLVFKKYWDHECCLWDFCELRIVDGMGTTQHFEYISLDPAPAGWLEHRVPLQPSWGRIWLSLHVQQIDFGVGTEKGLWIDDLSITALSCGVSTECVGAPLAGGAPGADLVVSGSTSIASADLVLKGTGFPPHTYALAFAGPDTDNAPLGQGRLCVNLATSVRLAVAPTRALGRPHWSLDLGAAPLSQVALVGRPLYVQAMFRDGASINSSAALRVDVCP